MKTMKLLNVQYKTDIRGTRYRVQLDEESQDHESHCHLFVIPFNQRTFYSCGCPQRKVYQENFTKLRES